MKACLPNWLDWVVELVGKCRLEGLDFITGVNQDVEAEGCKKLAGRLEHVVESDEPVTDPAGSC